jgi:hypothetical protein
MDYVVVTSGRLGPLLGKDDYRKLGFPDVFEDYVSSPLPFIVARHYLRCQQPLHVPLGDGSALMKSAVMAEVSSRSVKKIESFDTIDVSRGRSPASPGPIPDTDDAIRYRAVL